MKIMRLVANPLAVAKFTQQWSQWHDSFVAEPYEVIISYDSIGGRYWLSPSWNWSLEQGTEYPTALDIRRCEPFPVEGGKPEILHPEEEGGSLQWYHMSLNSDPSLWSGVGFAFESAGSGVVAAFMPRTDGLWNVAVFAEEGKRSYYCDSLVEMLSDDALKAESEAETTTHLRESSAPAIAPVTFDDLSALDFDHSRKYEEEEIED